MSKTAAVDGKKNFGMNVFCGQIFHTIASHGYKQPQWPKYYKWAKTLLTVN